MTNLEVTIPDPDPQPHWCDPYDCDAVPGLEADHVSATLATLALNSDMRLRFWIGRDDHWQEAPCTAASCTPGSTSTATMFCRPRPAPSSPR